MKKLALLLALIMVAAACVIPVSADEGKKYVPIFDFDTVTQVSQRPDMPTVDAENHINGSGCNTFVTATNVICVEAAFPAVDISGCDYLCFWLWLEDADLATKFTFGQITINGAGKYVEDADLSYPTGNSASWPKSMISNLIEGGAKAGWNLVKLPLDTSVVPANRNKADMTKISFFRLNCTSDSLKNKVVKFDNLYAYQEGATVPEPKKAGEEPTTPDTPAEKQVIKMFDFDTQKFGTLDTEGHVDGTGCNSFTFSDQIKDADTFVVKFDPIDLSGCDFVEFWFYVSDASKLSLYKAAQIELTSSGKCDDHEATWNLPASWDSIIVGGAKDGWNLIRLDINKEDDNHADWTAINYFRMYTLEPQNLAGVTIKFDDMYAYTEGADVPAPQKTTAPVDDPTPATFDAVSSIAVVAVAAMGVVLVASGKRH